VTFTFASLSADPANPVRTFRSFSEAARENAESRVRAGIHFRFAIESGLALGGDIGRYAVKTLLQPTEEVTSISR
jgi:class 3 adenylate cyclase